MRSARVRNARESEEELTKNGEPLQRGPEDRKSCLTERLHRAISGNSHVRNLVTLFQNVEDNNESKVVASA